MMKQQLLKKQFCNKFINLLQFVILYVVYYMIITAKKDKNIVSGHDLGSILMSVEVVNLFHIKACIQKNVNVEKFVSVISQLKLHPILKILVSTLHNYYGGLTQEF